MKSKSAVSHTLTPVLSECLAPLPADLAQVRCRVDGLRRKLHKPVPKETPRKVTFHGVLTELKVTFSSVFRMTCWHLIFSHCLRPMEGVETKIT